jgi:hypothetical protein
MGFGKALLLQAREKSFATLGAPSAAKAGIENKPLGAALKRCATQNHGNVDAACSSHARIGFEKGTAFSRAAWGWVWEGHGFSRAAWGWVWGGHGISRAAWGHINRGL